MRLIDVDALYLKIIKDNDYDLSRNENIAQILLRLETAPAIEAEPARHASWKGWTTSRFTGKYKDYDEPEFKDYQYYQCTECYRKSAIKELYCPSCGAKMDATDIDVGRKEGGTENG